MAGLRISTTSPQTALVAATAQTILQIKAPSNQRLLITGLSFQGCQTNGGSDPPILIKMTRSTSSFGTSTAITLVKDEPSFAETIQSSAAGTFTGEPTSTDSGRHWELPAQTSIILGPFPPGHEISVPGGTAVNFQAISSATPTLAIGATWSE